MHYTARITREGRNWLAEFIDAPGCQTFADSQDELRAAALEALEGWLEAYLIDREAPPRPRKIRARPGVWFVEVETALAVAVQLRWARQEAKLTQAQLARRAHVSQQQIAKLERPGSNPTLDTLAKVARALGVKLEVELGEEKRRRSAA
jgi:predicted RNase H-like HicB family nuclease/DNA-binding XRE family transcriptional regulator